MKTFLRKLVSVLTVGLVASVALASIAQAQDAKILRIVGKWAVTVNRGAETLTVANDSVNFKLIVGDIISSVASRCLV